MLGQISEVVSLLRGQLTELQSVLLNLPDSPWGPWAQSNNQDLSEHIYNVFWSSLLPSLRIVRMKRCKVSHEPDHLCCGLSSIWIH